MECPRCRADLASETLSDLALSTCARCGGVMLAQAAFDRVAASPELSGELLDRAHALGDGAQVEIDLQKVVYLSCPECERSMARKNFGRVSGAMIDVCIYHGIWFDRGELARSLEFLRDGGRARTDAFDRAEAAHEREQRKVIEEIEKKTRKGRGRWR